MRLLAPSRWKRSCEWVGEGGDAGVRDRSRVAVGSGRQMGLEARLAVGRDPLDAAIGGDALLKAAVHQLGVVALLLHLFPSQGQGSVSASGSGSGFRVRSRVRARSGVSARERARQR